MNTMLKISNNKLTKLSPLLTINVNTQTNILPVDFRLYYVLPLNPIHFVLDNFPFLFKNFILLKLLIINLKDFNRVSRISIVRVLKLLLSIKRLFKSSSRFQPVTDTQCAAVANITFIFDTF